MYGRWPATAAASTRAGSDRDGDDGTVRSISDRANDERERRLEALHEATRHLMAAEVHNEVAGIGVNAAAEIIGLVAPVHLITCGP